MIKIYCIERKTLKYHGPTVLFPKNGEKKDTHTTNKRRVRGNSWSRRETSCNVSALVFS